MKIVIGIVAVLAVLALVGWLGLRIQPASFPAYGKSPAALELMSIPQGLPAPVERWIRSIYGDQVPLIETAVISGRATTPYVPNP